jgi:phosphocarrier protein HPr
MSEYVHTLIVSDPIGLHARPIGQIVTLAKESGLNVSLRRPGGANVAAVSALKLLAMKVKTGEELEVVIGDADEKTAADAAARIEHLINQG